MLGSLFCTIEGIGKQRRSCLVGSAGKWQISGVNMEKADSLAVMVHLEGLSNSEEERTKVISPVEGIGQR